MRRITLMILILGVAVMAGAQDFNLPRGKWWDNPRITDRLDITEEQREQIRTRVYEHARTMIDLKANVQRAELELANLVMNSGFEAANARESFRSLQEARLALEMERFEMLLAVREVLTDQQWELIQEMRRESRRDRERDRPSGERPFRRQPPAGDDPGGGL